MNHPKSVYIAFEAFPRPKGASAHIASMLSAMAGSFGPVLFLCLGFGDMPSFQQEGNIFIRRFKAYHPNMLKRSQGFAEFVYTAICGLDGDPELCVFRDPWGGHAAIAAHRCRKTIFEVNALPSWELDYTYRSFSERFCLKEKIKDMERFCLEHSSRILTVSQVTAGALASQGVPPEKINVVPNCAPDDFIDPPPKEAVPDLFGGRSSSAKWIGYFGSLHAWQGVETGLKAFSMLTADADSNPHEDQNTGDVKMVIVTGARKSDKKQLAKKIRKLGLENRVLIHPPVAQDQLAAIVRRLYFTIAPLAQTPRNTVQGCCPVKIIESMAAGTPVIASDLACTRQIIQDREDGLLVAPDSARLLGLAMLRCLGDEKMVEQLGENAVLKIYNQFNRSRIHEKLTNCFNM